MKIRTKISQTINLRKYLNISVALFLFGFNSYLFSQEENKNQESNINNKNHQFGFTIKRANYIYYPEEYGSAKKNNSYGNRILELQNNREIINPFSFYYFNANRNLFFELSHYKLILADPYYYYYNGSTIYASSLDNIKRSETKLNIYSSASLNRNHQFFYGTGFRNLNKEQSSHYMYLDIGNSASTNGMQGFLKYQYKIFSLLSLTLSLEPFYTYGNLIINRRIGTVVGSSWQYNYNSNAKIYFYGVEVDTNLSFQFYENLSLIAGYNYTHTKIRYENYKDYSIIYTGEIMHLFLSPFHSNTDHIKNYYIGLNAKF